LGQSDTYKKICPSCRLIYSKNANVCTKCGGQLAVYDESVEESHSHADSNTWLYVVAVLLPIVGIILGCVYISKDENELGKSLIITSIVTSVIYVIITLILGACSA
jgi:hypothetical protein